MEAVRNSIDKAVEPIRQSMLGKNSIFGNTVEEKKGEGIFGTDIPGLPESAAAADAPPPAEAKKNPSVFESVFMSAPAAPPPPPATPRRSSRKSTPVSAAPAGSVMDFLTPPRSSQPRTSTQRNSASTATTKSPGLVTTAAAVPAGIFGYLAGWSWGMWLLVILLLAFVGVNVFAVLAKGTDVLKNITGPIMKFLAGTLFQTIDVSAEGAKAAVNDSAYLLDAGLTGIQQIHPVGMSFVHDPSNSLNQSLSSPSTPPATYDAHVAGSSINTAGKVGWCFVGQNRGTRTCAQVGENDVCMSGEIFPTADKCIHPSLRT